MRYGFESGRGGGVSILMRESINMGEGGGCGAKGRS